MHANVGWVILGDVGFDLFGCVESQWSKCQHSSELPRIEERRQIQKANTRGARIKSKRSTSNNDATPGRTGGQKEH
jgi:hypothetical protein